MPTDTKIRSPLTAGFMAAVMALHSPSGHDASYKGLLWLKAMVEFGQLISYGDFQKYAEIYTYHTDADVHRMHAEIVKGTTSFCLPFGGQDEQPDVPQNFNACHAAAVRENKKDKKGIALL